MSRHSAYTELLQRHRKMVWRLCWKYARGHYDRCCDLVQEVSIALWIHFDDLRPDTLPEEERAWVHWWARSVLDLQRRKERPSLLPLTTVADTMAADNPLAQQEEMEHLMAALSPEEQRLVKLHIEGYRSREIAEMMGLGRDVAYQRIHRALVKARKAMLVAFLLLVATSIAIAVVPSWRQRVFGGGAAEEEGAIPVSAPKLRSSTLPTLVDSVCATTPVSKREVNWEYVGVGLEGWSVTWCRNDSSISYTRTPGGLIATVPRAFVENDTLKIDSMNISLKRTATTAALMALTTAPQAQVAYDFQSVTPQGDTLFCTVTDSAQHHVSVRGDESVWNAPYIHYNDTLVIPSSVEHNGVQFTVSALGDSAFYNHGEITAAVIPVSVTAIGGMAFASTGINELVVPDSVNTIGAKAFGLVPNVIYHGAATGAPWGALTVNGFEEDGLFYLDISRTAVTACRPWVTQAVLPASVRSIGRYAFSLSQLESITLPEGLETIGNSAFQSCSRLGSVVIPSTVTEIGRYAFYNAFRTSSEATVTIADAECSIGQGAFCYSNMSAIDLGSRVTSIGQDAFASLGRTDSIIVPNSCTYLAARAFCYNYSGCLRKVHLPDNLDTIRDELLHGCTGLEEVNIPQSVVYIGEMALAELFSVMELTLPAGLTYIGPWALGSCTNISEMTSLAVVPPQACDNSFEDLNANLMLTVPCGSVEGYRTAPYWGDFQNIYDDCEAVPEVEPSEVIIKASWRRIIVEGAEGEVVTVYDAEGRQVTDAIGRAQCILRVPDAGLYLVKVGKRPAVKVVSR